jgi:rod shape-determining protein MreD
MGAAHVTPSAAFRVLVVIGLVLLVQSTVGLDIRIAGAHPELGWLLPIVAGLLGGPEVGAVVGFVAGMAVDLFLPTPFGLTALVGCVLGALAGWAPASSGPIGLLGPWTAPVVALAGSAGAVMLYAVLGAVLGQDQMLRVDLGAVIGVVAVVNALAVVPVRRMMRWGLGLTGSSRSARSAAGAPW